MISTTIKSSSQVHINPYEEIEIDFSGFLKPMNDDEFYEFCRRHKDLRIEMEKDGEIIIMPPPGSETGIKNFKLTGMFWVWVERDGSGEGFDSSTGFILPNGAKRSPDLSWMTREKWNSIPPEKRKKFAPVSPDFVVELRSETDNLAKLQDKMREYIENGARLGWLIDATTRKVYVYRPEQEFEMLENPAEISGEPVLPGFVLNLQEIWE